MRWIAALVMVGCGATQGTPEGPVAAGSDPAAEPEPECVARLVDGLWPAVDETMAEAERFATLEASPEVFVPLDASSRRMRAYDVSNAALAEGLADAIYAILDERGRVIARDRDRNRAFGSHWRFADAVIASGAATSVIVDSSDLSTDGLALGAVAPIRRPEGTLLGAAVVLRPLPIAEWKERSGHEVVLAGAGTVVGTLAETELESLEEALGSMGEGLSGLRRDVAGTPYVGASAIRDGVRWVLLRPADAPCPAAAPTP